MSEENAVVTDSPKNNDLTSVEEDEQTLKGDAIGDTLYSESWVLKTLMNLTKELPKYSSKPNDQEHEILELEESLETDLCLLWDMTGDKDVANCLLQHDILTIIKCAIEESLAPRLTEISVGILANLSCQKDIGRLIVSDEEWITTLVEVLSSEDTPTVIQLVRLFDTLLRSFSTEQCAHLLRLDKFLRSLSFILQSSLNEELLCGSSKLIDILTSHIDPKEQLPCQSILEGIFECQKQLKAINSSGETQIILEAFDALVSALYNFSRNDVMRTEMVNRAESVRQFLETYLSCLLRTIREDWREERMESLTVSAVEAVTIYYVVIDSTCHSELLELSGYIGQQLDERCNGESNEYVSDYREIVGDCIRKKMDVMGTDGCLDFLEPLHTKALSFLLVAAHRTVPERLQELIRTARTRNAFNKLVETYESFTR